MILPGNYALSCAIMILGTLCLGSWANTQKQAGSRWRYELYYIDFAAGALIAAILAGLTLGNMGWDGFSLMDDLRMAGKRQELFAFLAGCVFNLANFLLVAAISLTGLSISFPVTMGIGLVTGAVAGLLFERGPSVLLTSAGCGVVLLAVTFAVMAWREFDRVRLAAAAPTLRRKGKASPRTFAFKGILIASAGGLLMGSFYPLIRMARYDENGLGPYALGLIFAVGVLMSTLVYCLFFINLPIQGQPIEIGDYFRGSAKQHMFGWLGGILWLAGTLAGFVVFRANGPAQMGPALAYALRQAAVPLAALWGLIVWKELSGANSKVRTLIAASLFLYVGGVALISIASSNTAR